MPRRPSACPDLALEAGAVGYVPKRSSEPELLAALRSVLSGETGVAADLLSMMDARRAIMPSVTPPVVADGDKSGVLSRRQHQVLQLLASSLPNKLVARQQLNGAAQAGRIDWLVQHRVTRLAGIAQAFGSGVSGH